MTPPKFPTRVEQIIGDITPAQQLMTFATVLISEEYDGATSKKELDIPESVAENQNNVNTSKKSPTSI